MNFSDMSVGKKSSILILLVGFLIIFFSAVGMWFYIMELEKTEYDNIRKNMQLSLEKELFLKENVSISNAVGISSNQDIIESLSSGDRERALKTIQGIGRQYKEKTPFKNIKVHVHTKDVKSFVRGWKPDKYGDDLSSFRYTINTVKRTGKPITAMEVGRAGMTLRSVVPVNNEAGEYVGSLEFIQGLNSVQKTLKKDGIEFLLLMHKSGLKDAKQLSEKTVVGDYLLDLKSFDKEFLNYVQSLDLSKINSNSYYIDDKYYITALEVKDFNGKNIGLYLLGEDVNIVSAHVNQSKTLIYAFLTVSSILVVFIIIIVLITNHFMMVRPIVSSVEEIIEASSQINDASTQIADSSISLAEDSSIQSKNVEDINQTIVYTAEENHKNSQSINEATRLAKVTNESANEGSDKINNLVVSMDEITKASEQIHKIVKTIDEIASQTHLLALNAAVEAARAGEHGLGFAVVADEVKALASRSATAARETTGIIEMTISLIEQGSSNADESKQAFVTILDNANKTASLIHEIADSINEQTTKMNNIKTSMSQIDVNIQSNAAISEEMAASSEELNAQTVTLNNTIHNVGKLVGYDVEES